MNTKVWLIAVSSALLSLPCFSADSDFAGAETVVRNLTHEIYSTLQSECRDIGAHPERLYSVVDQVLSPHADLDGMSRWVLGAYWRELDEGQRSRFEEEFGRLLVRTYGTAIQTVSPDDINYLPSRGEGRTGQATVRTQIQPAGEVAIRIDYAMHFSADSWLVYDVRVEGVSLVTNYRTMFAEQIRRVGVAGLIEALGRSNRQPLSAEVVERIRALQSRSCTAASR